MNKKDNKTWIAEAIAKHGDKYDYSDSVYVGAREKVWILCPKHGKFEQRAYAHSVNGQGCPHCANELKSTYYIDYTASRYNDMHNNKYRITTITNKPTHWVSNIVTSADVHNAYGFVYIITNLVSGRMYIGKKRTNKRWHTYKGSSMYLRDDILKYGADNYKYEIVGLCSDASELRSTEIELISSYNATVSDKFYNNNR